MTGMDCILCKVLWTLHLSRKTEAKKTTCLQGSMKLLSGEFTFCDMCVFVWVCMREKEREGNYSGILGEVGHRFIRLSRVL